MCGIAGAAWSHRGEPLQDVDLQRMIAVLQHRGPDDWGVYHSACGEDVPSNGTARHSHGGAPGAALGFRRLSIIDLEGGHQPLGNEDASVWIVFNGEIYNYRELRPDLEAHGHVFRTSTDTEVIVHLYEQYGPDCVQRLRGMFAFAIWDQRRRRLFLARDRVGKKPLFYRHAEGRLVFASELKALLQLPNAPRTLDVRAIDQYLAYQYVPHPHCILQGYNKLPPAHFAVYEDDRLRLDRYWSPPFSLEPAGAAGPAPNDPTRDWSKSRWHDELRAVLTEAVRLRLRSDVPLGAFLSGGIDSTIIVGLMQKLSDQPVHTFSIGFPVKQFDERAYAREAARHLGTQHSEAIVEPSALEILPRLIWHYDEPFADSSAIPTMYLCEMTRRHVTVALSGDGGDELFAGYDRYRAVRLGALFDRLPRVVKTVLTSPLWQKLPASVRQRSRRRQLKRLLAALGEEPRRRYLKWIGIFDDDRRRALYHPDFLAQLDGADAAEFLLRAYQECPSRDFVTQTTCADLLTYIPCDILTKVDLASMAYSLECRSPFLDHRVIELAARMPIELKLRGWHGKRILIDTFRDFLPPSIRRRRKMGFGVPLNHWFCGELKPLLYDALLDETSLGRGFFDRAYVRQLVEEHVHARWDHSYRLWSLLCFELWQRLFLDPATPPARGDTSTRLRLTSSPAEHDATGTARVSSHTSDAVTSSAPFEVYSVHFDFAGGQAIRLREPVTDQFIGDSPEWVAGVRDALAAYVRATGPEMRVVFRGTPAADGTHTIGANGTLFQVVERNVPLAFNAETGLSLPEIFRANTELPEQIGLHQATLHWYVREQGAAAHCLPAGTSTHRIATTWRALPTTPAPEGGLPNWVYCPLMEWTCQWAAGQNDEKAICDAIIANVGSSGLRYGVPKYNVREMLLNQGGMCVAWYQAFQQMAHCQGVFVYRRRFLVDWRQMANEEELWCAIVIRSGGLNQRQPTHEPSTFHDNRTGFPIPAGTKVPIVDINERRYRFWGLPNYPYDGHCINFLMHNGGLHLYDACFGFGPIQIDAPLPLNNTNVAQGGADLAPFKAAYLDNAIDYMLGSIQNGPDFLRSIFVYPPGVARANGMTVRTTDIPPFVNGNDGLTFRWGN